MQLPQAALKRKKEKKPQKKTKKKIQEVIACLAAANAISAEANSVSCFRRTGCILFMSCEELDMEFFLPKKKDKFVNLLKTDPIFVFPSERGRGKYLRVHKRGSKPSTVDVLLDQDH